MTSQKMSTAVAMVVPLVALGVPVIDTLMSMVRRFVEKRPLFSGAAGKQARDADREAAVEQEAVIGRDTGSGLDGAWDMLVASCRASGFLGVGWHSVGLKAIVRMLCLFLAGRNGEDLHDRLFWLKQRV